MAVAGEVALRPARHRALSNVLFHARQFRHILIPDLRLHARALTHFREVPQQTKSGHVGHGLHAVDIGECRTGEVHLTHNFRCQTDMLGLQQGFLLGSGQYANAQRLGEEQFAARLRRAVALHAFGGHHAGDGQAEDRLRRIDRVTTGQGNTRLLAGKASAFDHVAGNLRREGVNRPAQNGDRHNRFTAHRKDIADGVGGRNASEVEWVVDNRHKKVSGADNAGAVT